MAASLKSLLSRRLKGAQKIGVLGVGSTLRGDDAAGMIVAEKLEKAVAKASRPCVVRASRPHRTSGQRSREQDARGTQGQDALATPLAIFPAETAPENFTGPIKQFAPSHLVIVDSANVSGKPGQIHFIDPEDLAASKPFSTHSLPIIVLVRYMRQFVPMETIIVGIQPETLEFGKPACTSVRRAAGRLAKAIFEAAAQKSR